MLRSRARFDHAPAKAPATQVHLESGTAQPRHRIGNRQSTQSTIDPNNASAGASFGRINERTAGPAADVQDTGKVGSRRLVPYKIADRSVEPFGLATPDSLSGESAHPRISGCRFFFRDRLGLVSTGFGWIEYGDSAPRHREAVAGATKKAVAILVQSLTAFRAGEDRQDGSDRIRPPSRTSMTPVKPDGRDRKKRRRRGVGPVQ